MILKFKELFKEIIKRIPNFILSTFFLFSLMYFIPAGCRDFLEIFIKKDSDSIFGLTLIFWAISFYSWVSFTTGDKKNRE